MPSAFTSDIYEGKDVSLRDYLMRVGRGMGFAIMQRDDDWDAPVRRVEPRTSYYDESEAKAEEKLKWLRALTPDEITMEARRAHRNAFRAWEERRQKDTELRQRYEAMLEQVAGWYPDPLLHSMKDQAIKYLRDSIDFDCDDGRWDKEPVEKEPAEWLQSEIDEALRSIRYAQEHRAEEIARTEERNRYIDAFHVSLPDGSETRRPA